jgi:hypothetical protein
MPCACRRSHCASSPECFMSPPHGASTDAKKGARNAKSQNLADIPCDLVRAGCIGRADAQPLQGAPLSRVEPMAGAAPFSRPSAGRSSAAGASCGRGAAAPAENLALPSLRAKKRCISRSRSGLRASAGRTPARSSVSRACQGAVRCRGRRRRETRLGGAIHSPLRESCRRRLALLRDVGAASSEAQPGAAVAFFK